MSAQQRIVPLVDKLIIDEQTKNITEVPSDIFQNMKTSEGVSISELNKQGMKVLLFFTSHIGCIFCQGTLNDIYHLKDQLMLLNVIPVICHHEDNATYEQFLNETPSKQRFKTFAHLERKKWNEYFKMESVKDLDLTFDIAMKNGGDKETERIMKEDLKLQYEVLTEETVALLAAVFVVSNEKIISEYRKEHKHQRFDIATVCIDSNNENNIGIDLHTSLFDCELIKKTKPKPFIFKKKIFEENEKNQNHSKCIEIPINFVLLNSNYLRFFKLFCTKQHCVENIIFFEEILNYKKLSTKERQKRSQQIFGVFFNEDSIYELKIEKKMLKLIKNGLNESSIELFDEYLTYLTDNIIIDIYKRFKLSNSYQSMIEFGKKKKNILFINESK
eukprot:gene1881-1022_t